MAESVPFLVDVATLLLPISAHQPAGEWLRYEGTYDAVQDARREEDDTLPKGIWTSKVKRADWVRVDALAQKALRERTKDLQLAVWLAEAWLQLYGLRGFAGGLHLCAQLMTDFWETLYPLVDEGDTAYRLAPVEFLDRKMTLRIKQLPLVKPLGDEQLALSFSDWERALHDDKTGQTGGGLSPAQFLAAAGSTPSHQFVVLHAELGAVDQAAAALEAVVAKHTGEPSFVLRVLRALLADIMALISQYTPEAAAVPSSNLAGSDPLSPSTGEPAEGDGESAVSAESPPTERAPVARREAAGGPIRSRNEAFRRLSEAADFLLRTEPHSPVPYLVKRAVTWGNMNLMQLLSELVSSDADRAAICTLLGIRAPQ